MLNPVPRRIVEHPLASAVRITDSYIVAIAVIFIDNTLAIVSLGIVGIGMHLLQDAPFPVPHLPFAASVRVRGADQAIKEIIGIAVFAFLLLPCLRWVHRQQTAHAIIQPSELIPFPVTDKGSLIPGIIAVFCPAAGIFLCHNAACLVIEEMPFLTVSIPDNGRFPASWLILVNCLSAAGIRVSGQPPDAVIRIIDGPALVCSANHVMVPIKMLFCPVPCIILLQHQVAVFIILVCSDKPPWPSLLHHAPYCIIFPTGFIPPTVCTADPVPRLIVCIALLSAISVFCRQNLPVFATGIKHRLIPNAIGNLNCPVLQAVFCPIGVTIGQGLQRDPAFLVIFVAQVSHLRLIHRPHQIPVGIILIMGNPLIHMDHVRQPPIFITVLHRAPD